MVTHAKEPGIYIFQRLHEAGFAKSGSYTARRQASRAVRGRHAVDKKESGTARDTEG